MLPPLPPQDFVLDVAGVNKHCPCIRTVWKFLAGYRPDEMGLDVDRIHNKPDSLNMGNARKSE